MQVRGINLFGKTNYITNIQSPNKWIKLKHDFFQYFSIHNMTFF
jgi:hypothetical protein